MGLKRSKKYVAVITDRRDAHVPFVERHLERPLIILDPQDILKGAKLTYRYTAHGVEASFNGVNLADVIGVWYRKPQEIDLAHIPVRENYKFYSQMAMQRHFNLLLSAMPQAKWVSDYFNIVRASDKSWQLVVAKQLGMRVPDTIITSDKTVAKAFIESRPRTVTKPLTNTQPKFKNGNAAFFTTLLDKGFVPDLSNLSLAPAIFQEAIDMVCDVRVTVVGDKVFPAAVRAEDLDPALRVYDYRLGHYEGKVVIEPLAEFPAELSKRCVDHTRALGLRFGALDFGMDKNGDFWFFENNPNGQWGFIEEAIGSPIGKALADLLQGK